MARNAERRLKQILGIAIVLGVSGCVYISDYIPPQDGRARVIWRSNQVVPTLAGGRLRGDCPKAVAFLSRVRYVEFLREKKYPLESNSFYPDWITEASHNFLKATKIYDISPKPANWQPTVYSTSPSLSPDTTEGDSTPLFDPSLFSQKRDAFGKPLDEFDVERYVTQGYTFSLLGVVGYSKSAYPDHFARTVLWASTNITATLLTPILGFTAVIPGSFGTGASEQVNYVANLVNSYNDLARVDGSPCAYPSAPPYFLLKGKSTFVSPLE